MRLVGPNRRQRVQSMTHLHIPDGVLPAWLWLGGAGVAAALIALAARIASGRDFRRRLPLLSIAAAFMVVSMSVPVIPAVYNVQLAAVVGIILGPALGVIAAFIVNLLLALVGHGGITIVGLNTLILGGEMLAAWVLFHLLRVALAPGVAGGVAGRRSVFVFTTGAVPAIGSAGADGAASTATGAVSSPSGSPEKSTLRRTTPTTRITPAMPKNMSCLEESPPICTGGFCVGPRSMQGS